MRAHFEPGEVVYQNFELIREIGRGAMGVVFLAVDCSLDRDVALKLMLPNAEGEPSSELTTRFLLEGRAVARLRGQHVAHVYEIGTTDDGNPFIVMEHLNGESLAQVLSKRRKVPCTEAVRYLLQACVGLSEAHARGIVHRDLKPANLFAHREYGGRLCLKVLDFGVAKLLFNQFDLTRSNQLIGTPLYMSPEQRSSGIVDNRTDIWSLGVILYQLVTGRVPFVGETVIQLDQKVLKEVPVEPYVLEPSVPLSLSQVILRCLEKDPANRYADVGQLAWDLSSFVEDEGPKLAAEVDQFLALEPSPRSAAVTPSLRVRVLEHPMDSVRAPVVRQGRWDSLDFFDEDTFIQAVVHRALDGKPMTFLVGSGLTAPFRTRWGIPDADALVRLVRERYRDRELALFDRELADAAHRRYTRAFSRLLATHGLREVKRTIRRAALQARRDPPPEEAIAGDPAACQALEADVGGWWLSEGVEALAKLMMDCPQIFGEAVLTSNFDPLIEIAIARAGGRHVQTLLSVDGGIPLSGGQGCNVVHLHGGWWGETMHAPHQLAQDRPKLATTLTPLVAGRTLVAIGCGGSDDALTQSLVKIVTGGEPPGGTEELPDVLWAFSSADRGHILRKYGALLDGVGRATEQGRFVLYKGVNLHNVLPALHRRLNPQAIESAIAEIRRTPDDGKMAQEGSGIADNADTLVSVYEHALDSRTN